MLKVELLAYLRWFCTFRVGSFFENATGSQELGKSCELQRGLSRIGEHFKNGATQDQELGATSCLFRLLSDH